MNTLQQVTNSSILNRTIFVLTATFILYTLFPFQANSQVSSQSKVHKPSTYTPPVDFKLLQREYLTNQNRKVEANQLGIAVKQFYNKYKGSSITIDDGWQPVYVVAENSNGTPTHCFEASAYVDRKNNKFFVSEINFNNKTHIPELSSEINDCKSQWIWVCGTDENGESIYCGFDIYFIKQMKSLYIEENKSGNRTKPNSQSSAKQSNGDLNIPQYGNDEFYDGYQIVDFANQIKFTPKRYKREEWENAVIQVFSSGPNGYANSKQLNIDAMYLCNKQFDVMYRRYTTVYGYLDKALFTKYCRLFIMLLKTDELSR